MKKFYLGQDDIQVLTRNEFLKEHKGAPFPQEMFVIKIDCVKDNALCSCGRCNHAWDKSPAFIPCGTRNEAETRQKLLQFYVGRFRVRSRHHEVNIMMDAINGRRLPQLGVTEVTQRIMFCVLVVAIVGTLVAKYL